MKVVQIRKSKYLKSTLRFLIETKNKINLLFFRLDNQGEKCNKRT